MALMDLKSNLSWYGSAPGVDYFDNKNAPGFTKNRKQLQASEFVGVQGNKYKHTGTGELGKLKDKGVNYFDDKDATGFTTNRKELDPSEFIGIQGEQYTHTGVRQLGNLKFADWITNDQAKGFTGNIYPLGGDKKKSQFVGISGEEFNYNGLQEIGNIVKNIRSNTDDKIIGGVTAETKFIYNGDLTVSITPKGFSYDGTLVELQAERKTADSFIIDDLTMSDRGLAKRKAQGGTGHPFTNTEGFGPYKWKPKVHTGWNPDQKYSDTIKKNKTAGLADTYTDASPIDDLYNKLNLREDAHQTGYIKHPLILRGIQREGKTNNQRWGLGDTIAGQISSTLDLPRGGILTSIERGVIDIARLAKFMVSPPGLAYMVKQLGQQLMNPNVEGKDGKVQKAFHKNSTKLFTPVNTLLQPLAGIAGMHIKRHGLLPVDLPGGNPGNYEKVHTDRALENSDAAVTDNRLIRLGKEYGPGYLTSATAQNLPIGIGSSEIMGILTGMTGPDSIGGIGRTTINRWADTTLKTQLGLGEAKAGAGGYNWADYVTAYYTYGRPYQGTQDQPYSGFIRSETDLGDNDAGKDPGAEAKDKVNLARRAGGNFDEEYNADDARWGIKSGVTVPEESVMGEDYKARWGEEEDNAKTKLESYNAIRKITKDRNPGDSAILDFRTIKDGTIKDYETGPVWFKPSQNKNIKDKKLTEKGYPSFLPSTEERDHQKDDFYSSYSKNSLIKFVFSPIDPGKTRTNDQNPIGFRAYIDSLDDAFSPQRNSGVGNGQVHETHTFTGFTRSISVSFKVPITSAAERWNVWNRLNRLASITMPLAGTGFEGQQIEVTIGDLYRYVPMMINDLTYSWDTETSWEITPGYQVPFITNVDMSLTWIGDQMPIGESNHDKIIKTNAYKYGSVASADYNTF